MISLIVLTYQKIFFIIKLVSLYINVLNFSFLTALKLSKKRDLPQEVTTLF